MSALIYQSIKILISITMMLSFTASSFAFNRRSQNEKNNTFYVNAFSDDTDFMSGDGICETGLGNGICTLRAAVQETNALAGVDTIILPPGIFVLTIPGLDENFAVTGDLDIRDDVIITGAGENNTIISANKLDRNIHVITNSNVQLSNLTLKDGANAASGGGIFNEGKGSLVIDHLIIVNNSSSWNGGGIDNNRGSVQLSNTTVFSNTAQLTTTAQGGGIYNNKGMLIISSSSISGNNATYHGGGISSEGSLSISDSIISNNYTASSGGGVYNYPLSTLDIENTMIQSNYALKDGGGITQMGDLTHIDNSTIFSNTTEMHGGGIFTRGDLEMTNSTVSYNQASSNGGGIYNSGIAQLASITVNENYATLGGGIYQSNTITSSLYLANTIIANHIQGGNCYGLITSLGYNMVDDGTCTLSGPGDTVVSDPELDSLQDNGGATFTHALAPTSPAIDAGNPSGCKDPQNNLLTQDQRGYFRHADGDGDDIPICDIGSYEYITADLSIDKDNYQSITVPGTVVTYTIVMTNLSLTPIVDALVTDNFPAEIEAVNWSCTQNGNSTCDTEAGSGDIDTLITLYPEEPLIIYALTTVSSGAIGDLINTVEISTPGDIIDPNPDNNTSTDVDILAPEADLLVSIHDYPDPVEPGSFLTYTITVTNSGPSDGLGITTTNILPAGIIYDETVGEGWNCNHIGNEVICARNNLVAGNHALIDITVIAPTSSGTITNTAFVETSTFDPLHTNNYAQEITAITFYPTISDIPDQTTRVNNPTPPIGFTIGDVETPASELVVNGNSSNQILVPNDQLIFGGTGENRTLTIIPAEDQSGLTMITVTVSDGIATTSDTFYLTVSGYLTYLPLLHK